MNDDAPTSRPPAPAPLPIAGRAAFRSAVLQALDAALAAGERELCFVDPDFEAWPLDEPALLQRLTRWARPARRLRLLACHYDTLQRERPRFVAWRRTWAHLMHCRAAPAVDASQMPTLLMAGESSLQLIDRAHWRGRWLVQENDRRTWHEVIDAISQRSEEAFPADTLGL